MKNEITRMILEMSYKGKMCHIGSALGCRDILINLWLQPNFSTAKFILSKSHAAAALYAVMTYFKEITEAQYQTIFQDKTFFPAHIGHLNIHPRLLFGGGSLGHGASLGTGIALAQKLQLQSQKTYVLLSDGELNEGQTWEALFFASHHRLKNLRFIIDANGLQGLGATADILNLGELTKRFESLNFAVESCDGHDDAALKNAHAQLDLACDPQILIAKTIKGQSISFMENKFNWHYHSLDEETYQQALRELL